MKKQRNSTAHQMVMAALLAALVCVATMLIKVPSPLKGYLNLGDGIVLLCGWFLPPMYSFFAAGIGSGLADFFAGYAVYVPATFVIKGLMALVAYWGMRLPWKKYSKVLAGVAAEVIMVLGYLLFEGLLYGFASAMVNVPANAIQGVAGVLLGMALSKVFKRTNLFT